MMKQIGWIGTGVMGQSMARHLLIAGNQVMVYNRTITKTKELVDSGAVLAANVEEVAQKCDIIFTMLGFPADVEEVYEKIFNIANEGTIMIDMTTSSPKLAKELYLKGKNKGISVIDAPVSGGDTGARNATLSIMAGGEIEVFTEVLPLFETLGTSVKYMGEAGNGQHTKMANQIAVAGATSAMCEAIIYAKKVGMNPATVIDAISKGAAGSWQLSNMASRVINDDFEAGFYIKHFIKDMRLAKEESAENEVELRMLATVLKMYEEMSDAGYDNLGSQALIKFYDK